MDRHACGPSHLYHPYVGLRACVFMIGLYSPRQARLRSLSTSLAPVDRHACGLRVMRIVLMWTDTPAVLQTFPTLRRPARLRFSARFVLAATGPPAVFFNLSGPCSPECLRPFVLCVSTLPLGICLAFSGLGYRAVTRAGHQPDGVEAKLRQTTSDNNIFTIA